MLSRLLPLSQPTTSRDPRWCNDDFLFRWLICSALASVCLDVWRNVLLRVGATSHCEISFPPQHQRRLSRAVQHVKIVRLRPIHIKTRRRRHTCKVVEAWACARRGQAAKKPPHQWWEKQSEVSLQNSIWKRLKESKSLWEPSRRHENESETDNGSWIILTFYAAARISLRLHKKIEKFHLLNALGPSTTVSWIFTPSASSRRCFLQVIISFFISSYVSDVDYAKVGTLRAAGRETTRCLMIQHQHQHQQSASNNFEPFAHHSLLHSLRSVICKRNSRTVEALRF